MGLHCRACGLFLEVRSTAPKDCPRCLAKRGDLVELVVARYPPSYDPAPSAASACDSEVAERIADWRALEPRPSPEPAAGRDRPDQLAAALELARAQTAMDVAALGEVRNGREIAHSIAGDGASFGLRLGASLPIKDTYCERLLEGRISNIVRDAQHDQRVNDLPLTRRARIGAYIGVPLSVQDARLYILCCLAHEQRPHLGEHDVLFMHGLAATIIAALPTIDR